MKNILRYLTHPQVQIDPEIPVADWGLSVIGRNRTCAIKDSAILQRTTNIVSSKETKAKETAEIIAKSLGINVSLRENMHENDRSSTGYLDSAAFEKMADAFFAKPQESVKGWEKAIDAQSRIVRETETYLKTHEKGDILFVGHGAVGTLLYCHFAGLPIDRMYDQPVGGGNFFSVQLENSYVIHGWKNMDDLETMERCCE